MRFFNYSVLSCILFFFTYLAEAAGTITLDSDPGDYIGQGQHYDFSGSQIGGVTIDDNYISINTNIFRFNFVIPSGQVTSAGGAFFGAQRYPFNGPLTPGIDVSGDGRGCNTIVGEFYIYEADKVFSKLAMDFVQHCEGSGPALRGSIRINSSIETPFAGIFGVISPSVSSAREGSILTLSASKSVSQTPITSYIWTQTSGKPVTFDSVDASDVVVTLPSDVDLGGEVVQLQVTTKNEANYSSIAKLSINVASKSDPETYFKMSGQGGDYISGGRSYEYYPSNSAIGVNAGEGGASVSISGREDWNVSFAAPFNTPFIIGEYPYAERFQSTTAAGLSIFGDGRGCNQSFGSFEVLQFSTQAPLSFKAKFEQRCESVVAPALVGEIAYNAVNENVPIADVAPGSEVFEGEIASLDGSGSYDPNGSNLSFLWSTPTPNLEIQNATMSRAYFVAPTLASRQKSKVVTLTLLVKTELGYKAKKDTTFTVLANNKAPVAADDVFTVLPTIKTVIRPLNNDTDSDGTIQSDSISIKTRPANGSVIVNSNGTLEYNQSGAGATSDEIRYTVKDNDGAESSVAVIKITIDGTPFVPSNVNVGGAADIYSLLLSLIILIVARFTVFWRKK